MCLMACDRLDASVVMKPSSLYVPPENVGRCVLTY